MNKTEQMYFKIKYNSKTEKYRIHPIESTTSESLNGMKDHIEKDYKPKALMDVIRRASGYMQEVSRGIHEHVTKLEYKTNIFIVDGRIEECGKTFLDIAVEKELSRI